MPVETDSLTSVNDDVKELSEGELETPEVEKPESSETEKPEVIPPTSEEEEVEEKPEPAEEEEPKPEDLQFHARPKLSEVKAKYPNLFKDFPALKSAMFREEQYTEVFPTIEEAKEASENNEAFSSIRDSAFSGDPSKFFSALNETDPKVLTKLASNMMGSLYKISPDAHWAAMVGPLENVVRAFYRQGDENQKNAALVLSHYLFGDENIANGKSSIPRPELDKPDERSQELDRREQAINNREYLKFDNSVRTDADKSLRSSIDLKQHIDPDGVMSDFIRTSVVNEVTAEVNKQMQADPTHMANMQRLWKSAQKAGYTDEWKARLIDAYLARAKSLIPAIRSKLVSAALGTSSNANGKKRAKIEELNSRREPGTQGRPSKEGSAVHDPKKIDWSKTSDDDFLNDKVTFKN